jgi:hypothetical protein
VCPIFVHSLRYLCKSNIVGGAGLRIGARKFSTEKAIILKSGAVGDIIGGE